MRVSALCLMHVLQHPSKVVRMTCASSNGSEAAADESHTDVHLLAFRSVAS